MRLLCTRCLTAATMATLIFAVATLAAVPGSAIAAPAPQITIETPTDGSDTSARTVVVTGMSPPRRKGRGYVERRLRVNGRRIEIHARRDGRYQREVVLEVGRNVITAKARIYRSWRDKRPAAIVPSTPVVITRIPVPGDATGTLDLATSYLVTDWSDAVYWLCGESDDCATRVACFQVTATRADCPAASRWRQSSGPGPWRCGFVMSISLAGDFVYFGRYRCRGAWRPDPKRFVRPEVERATRRFTVDLRGSPWLRDELADPNRYGLPRFDGDRDVIIP